MNKNLQIFILFLSVLIVDYATAQNTRVDSLENILKLHKAEDTAKVNLLNKIAYSVYNNDAKKTLNYATQAGELSDKLNFLKGKAESTWLIGISYDKSDKLLALDYFQKALKIAEAINYKTGIANYLNASANVYKFQGNDSLAIACYQKAIKISEELNDKFSMAKYLQNLSIVYSGEGKYKKAIEGHLKAIEILEELNENVVIIRTINNLGAIYGFQGNYPQALEYYQKALKIAEKQNDKSGGFNSLISISDIYLSQADYQKAFDQTQKALKIAEELKESKKISICLISIGNIFQHTNNPQALDYYKKALEIGKEKSDKALMLNTLVDIGDLYLAKNNYKNAFENYQEALKIAEEVGRKRLICEIWNKMGTIYFKQRDYAKALSNTLKSLEIANELKLLNNQKDIYYQLSEIYSASNDYRNAYKNHKLYKELNDSIYNKENVKKIVELEYTYKYEKEKQAIESEQQKKDAIQVVEKKQQRIIILSLVVGFILMSLFAIYAYYSYRAKHKTNLVLTKQKHDIEELNEEYQALNEELIQSNEQLFATKNLVEESEEKLRLLIKNSNDIFVLVNEKGEQHFISDVAKNLTGYSVEELLGSIEDVIYSDDLEIVKQHWSRVLSDKNTVDTVQYRHKHREKGYVWFEAVAQNFLDNPAINSVVANIRDITERKRIEEALKESEATKEKLMTQEIERINQELESNQRSITAATLKLIQNSERDTQTIEQLKEIEKNTNSEGKNRINTLISDYKRVSYSSNWEEFEILFEKVHSSFYEKLNSQFPDLTPNERKICAFLKLNMSSKDIAQITFQSEDALKKARLRLRQKLGIDRETNLVTFIQNV